MKENIMTIKDCLFEIVMSGQGDVKYAANYLHHVDGYKKEDIMTALREMQNEMED